MRNIIIFLTVWYAFLFQGCSTPSPERQAEFEAKAGYVGDWVAERSGLIQVAVQATTHVIIYSQVDIEDRQEVVARIHVIADNLSALVDREQVDPDAVRQALKAKEQYINTALIAVASLYSAEYEQLRKNGYGNLSISILRAVANGVRDGTIQ